MSSQGNESSSLHSRKILEPCDNDPPKFEVLRSVFGDTYLEKYEEGQDVSSKDVHAPRSPRHKVNFPVPAEEAITPYKLIKILEEGSKILRDHIRLLENHAELKKKHVEQQWRVEDLMGQLDGKDSLILALQQRVANQDLQIQEPKNDRPDNLCVQSGNPTQTRCGSPTLRTTSQNQPPAAHDQPARNQHLAAPPLQQTLPFPTSQIQDARARSLATSPPLTANATRSGGIRKRKPDLSHIRGKARGGRLQARGRAGQGVVHKTEGGVKMEKGEDGMVIKNEGV
ncbi:MAG: hypothetical protein Q9183_004362 [Haloplaca sp. 2 TL-2023]